MAEILTKAENTKKRIFETALKLFEEIGFQKATMRLIAREAGYSLGLTYRYFETKEEMVLDLYEKILEELSESLKDMPEGKLAERFKFIMTRKLTLIHRHRSTLGALFSTMLNPGNSMGVFSESTEIIRRKGSAIFLEVIKGAADAPREAELCSSLARFLYMTHLGLILLWFIDKSKENKSTTDALEFIKDILGLVSPMLSNPFAALALERIDRILKPVLYPAENNLKKEDLR